MHSPGSWITGIIRPSKSHEGHWKFLLTDLCDDPSIIAGSLLGLLLSWFCYRLYYPPLTHHLAHKPYSPRIPESEDSYGTQASEDRYSPEHEGPEGTLKRPSDGTGQGPIAGIALREANNRSRDSYGDLEAGR